MRWTDVLWQVDANNKRDAELRKVKRELEDTQAQRDSQMAALRKKNQDVANELNEQIDQLQKAKLKYATISTITVYQQHIAQRLLTAKIML